MERKKHRSKSKNEEKMSKELKVLYGFQPLFSLCPNVRRTQVPQAEILNAVQIRGKNLEIKNLNQGIPWQSNCQDSELSILRAQGSILCQGTKLSISCEVQAKKKKNLNQKRRKVKDTRSEIQVSKTRSGTLEVIGKGLKTTMFKFTY